MNVVWVDALYAFSDRQHDRIIVGIGPCLEIANIHPNDIRDIHIAITEVSSESRRFPWWLWSGHDVFLQPYRRYTSERIRRVLRGGGLRMVFLRGFATHSCYFPHGRAAEGPEPWYDA